MAIGERRICYIFLVPMIVFLAAIIFVPIAMSLQASFYDWQPAAGVNDFVGLKNYADLFSDQRLPGDVIRTFQYVSGALLIELPVGLGIALLLNSIAGRKQRLLLTAILTPLMICPVIVGVNARQLLYYEIGAVRYLLDLVGIASPRFLGDPHWVMVGLVLTDVWQYTPFIVLIMFTAIQTLPTEPYEAAVIDGASRAQMFWHVTIPLLRPILIITLVLRAADAFRVFDYVFAMTSGGPGTASETLPFYLNLVNFKWFFLGYGSTLAVLLTAIIMLMTVFALRAFWRESL